MSVFKNVLELQSLLGMMGPVTDLTFSVHLTMSTLGPMGQLVA